MMSDNTHRTLTQSVLGRLNGFTITKRTIQQPAWQKGLQQSKYTINTQYLNTANATTLTRTDREASGKLNLQNS
jgi:hypothetical protein